MPTPLEILSATLNGKALERIPVFCNLIDQGAVEMGLHPREYFSNGQIVAEAQLRMLTKYDHDNVWSLFYVGKEAELLGQNAQVHFSAGGAPNVSRYALDHPQQIFQHRRVPIEEHPAFVQIKLCLQMLQREIGSTHPICAYFSSSMTLPAMLLGMDQWMEILLLGPNDLRNAILDFCHDFFVEHVQAYRRLGANVLIYSNPFGSLDTLPLKLFHELALPWIQKDLQAIGTQGVVYYCGMSRMNAVIPHLLQSTDLQIYYTSPLDDLSQSISLLQHNQLCCGIMNDLLFLEWDKAQMRAEVQKKIAIGLQSSKFLLGTGLMPLGISTDCIQAYVEAAKEFGQCP